MAGTLARPGGALGRVMTVGLAVRLAAGVSAVLAVAGLHAASVRPASRDAGEGIGRGVPQARYALLPVVENDASDQLEGCHADAAQAPVGPALSFVAAPVPPARSLAGILDLYSIAPKQGPPLRS
jgi:hypothetical protein